MWLPRPKNYYILLLREFDYYLDEVTVLNNIHRNNLLNGVVNKIPFSWMAQSMFVDSDNKQSGRGNKLWDAGFTGLNSTDASIVPGLNLPGRILKTKHQVGHSADDNREHTMLKIGCNVMQVAEIVREIHPRKQSIMASEIFHDKNRQNMFSRRWGEDVGIETEQAQYCNFEGSSCFGTGETHDYTVLKCERHVDGGNARENGQDHCPTIARLVEIKFDDGTTRTVRVGTNIYNKAHCSMGCEKLKVLQKIATIVDEYDKSRARPSIDDNGRHVNLHLKFVPPPSLDSNDDMWTTTAHADKDAYYSLYANEMNELSYKVNHNKTVLIEAMLTIPMTPCPKAWRQGIRASLNLFLDSSRRPKKKPTRSRTTNFILTYINWMTKNHGSVSYGEHARCQSSHHGRMSYRDMYLSCLNLCTIIEMANETLDTKSIIKRMCNSTKTGGLHGVGPFYAQHMVKIAILVGLITRASHSSNVAIATSTQTYKRLKMLGIKNKIQAAAVIPYLSATTGDHPEHSENKLCEALRLKFGKDNTKDVFVRGHLLYRVVGDRVYTVDKEGTYSLCNFVPATFNENDNLQFCWRDADLSCPVGGHIWDYGVAYLSKRTRKA